MRNERGQVIDFIFVYENAAAGRMPGDPTVYVCHPAATDPTMAPEGKSGLYLMVNAPPLQPGPDTWSSEADRLEV